MNRKSDQELLELMLDRGYDVALICNNGHLINPQFIRNSEHNQSYCEKCGASTNFKCVKCHNFIQGEYAIDDLTYKPLYRVPKFCLSCGEAHIWTRSRLDAAMELADELNNLSEDEKILLKKSIDEIVSDSPKTSLAATRFKRLIIKGGKEAMTMFKDILIDITSETAKKIIWQ